MKINFSPVKFKGYDAVPLKTLYMQGLPDKEACSFFEELKKIGKEENFDVFVHSNGKLLNDTKVAKIIKEERDIWAQDNKIIRPNSKVLSSKLELLGNAVPSEFANLAQKDIQPTNTVFEGGNMFIGKKDNGEEYILVGVETLMTSGMFECLKEENVKAIDGDLLKEFMDYGMVTTEEDGGGDIVNFKTFEENPDYSEKAKEIMAEEFGVKKENIFVIKQPNFHLDMNIRPIGYPYILVNDPEIAIKNLGKIRGAKDVLESTKKQEEQREKEYCDIETTIKELESYGFKPIRIAGNYGAREVNFMNAIVNKHEDGSITYITNSSNCDEKAYNKLEKIFEKELKKKGPKVKKVHFVQGENEISPKINTRNPMMTQLFVTNGGVHCMVCEEPDFSKY